ncbi:hypothetical protein [uncultured Pontibacter sp.]|uniref:hypothetical protein n=1 Tax=uncultured Pontibacter sp. TaxID=453356 RepID=UPI0026313827|nr:hypothetical protein [uncultured Pontibacter sp.]
MTPEQIEVGDKLLKHLYQEGGASNLDSYPSVLKRQGYDYYKQIGPTVITLKSFGFVESPDDYNLRLTSQGYEAAKSGLAEYFKKQDYAADLDAKSKKSGISTNRWTVIGVAVAIVVSVTSLGLQLVDKLQEKGEERNDNSQGSANNINDSKSEVLISELIPEIANSLKHDSVFVKELAKELKRQQ